MATLKTFELAVLISLINGVYFMDTTEEDLVAVVHHVHGGPVSEEDYQDAVDRTIDHINQSNPKVAEAATVMAHSRSIDQPRYNKLCDLYRKNHQVEQLTQQTA